MNWNIFGYDLGGPLFIPKIYEAGRKRTFFYFNQQWVRQKAGSQATGAAPLAEMRGQGTPNGELLFPGTSASPIKGIGGPYGIAFLADPSLPAGHCKAGDTKSCFAQDAAATGSFPPTGWIRMRWHSSTLWFPYPTISLEAPILPRVPLPII